MRPEKMNPSDGAENPKVFKFEDSVDGDEKKPEQCTYKSWCVSAIIREMSQDGDAIIEPSLLTKANKQCPKECHPEPDSDISEAKGFSLGIRASERSRVSINAKLVAANLKQKGGNITWNGVFEAMREVKQATRRDRDVNKKPHEDEHEITEARQEAEQVAMLAKCRQLLGGRKPETDNEAD